MPYKRNTQVPKHNQISKWPSQHVGPSHWTLAFHLNYLQVFIKEHKNW